MQRQSTQLFVEFIISLYPESCFQHNQEYYQQIVNMITTFISNPATFQQCAENSLALTGTSQPIERLNDILNVSSEPIPYNDEDSDTDDSNSRKKSRTWTTYEDDRLIAGIYKFGIENWTSISRFVGNGRSRSQCSQRWQRGLDPHLSKDQWTLAEEANLLRLVQYYGEKSWTQIAAKMGNRSDVQCRYKYKQMQKDQSSQSKSPIQAAHPYGPGVRKTHSNIIPPMATLPAEQTHQHRFSLNLNQNQIPIPPPTFVPNQMPQQNYFDQYQFNQNYQQFQTGNLKTSNSVPTIQYQHLSQPNINPFAQMNTTYGQNYLPPVPPSLQLQLQQQIISQNQFSPTKPEIPIPPPNLKLQFNKPSTVPYQNSIFSSLNDSFFDDNEFDAAVNNADMKPDIQTASSLPQSSLPTHNNPFDTSNGNNSDDSVGFSLPTFDSDLFSII